MTEHFIYKDIAYRLKDKRAKVGDLVLIVDDTFYHDPHDLEFESVHKVVQVIPKQKINPLAKKIQQINFDEMPERYKLENGALVMSDDYLVMVNPNAPLEKDLPDETPKVFTHKNPLTLKEKTLVKKGELYYRIAPRKTAQLGDFVIVVDDVSEHFFALGEVAELKLVWSTMHQADVPAFVGQMIDKGMVQHMFKDDFKVLVPLKPKELKEEGLYQVDNTFSIDGELYEYDFDRYKAKTGDLIEYNEGDRLGGIWNGDIYEVVENEHGEYVIFDRDGHEMDINDYPYTILKKVERVQKDGE